MTHVLDASAVLAHVHGERGKSEVSTLYRRCASGRARAGIHAVNVCEVFYHLCRLAGSERAEAVLRDLVAIGLHVERSIPDALWRRAGRLKVDHQLALADAFAVGYAALAGAALLTADHHELDSVDAAGEATFVWIR